MDKKPFENKQLITLVNTLMAAIFLSLTLILVNDLIDTGMDDRIIFKLGAN